ncbi:conserved hypothetical protein [Desulfarculales bacterium]
MLTETFMLPKVGMRGTLLNAVTGTNKGEWMNAQGFERFSIHVLISNTATAQVLASNEIAPGVDDDGGLVEQVTASGFVQLRAPARWIKVKVSAHTSGTVSAFIEAVP